MLMKEKLQQTYKPNSFQISQDAKDCVSTLWPEWSDSNE